MLFTYTSSLNLIYSNNSVDVLNITISFTMEVKQVNILLLSKKVPQKYFMSSLVTFYIWNHTNKIFEINGYAVRFNRGVHIKTILSSLVISKIFDPIDCLKSISCHLTFYYMLKYQITIILFNRRIAILMGISWLNNKSVLHYKVRNLRLSKNHKISLLD